MSSPEHESDSPVETQDTESVEATENDEQAEKKLDLDVQITDTGPCKKHLKVSIPQDEIQSKFQESLGNVRKEAFVPGFRPGRAPTSLVQKRYKKEVAGQVKSTLLVSALEQLEKDYKINPISQPDLDVEAIALPDDGPMQFEMDVEVAPDFELPDYKSIKVQRPVREITDAAVDTHLQTYLEGYAQLVPKLEGGAELGDIVIADLQFLREGTVQSEAKEVQLRLQSELRFQDGHIPNLDQALLGAKPGETRQAEALIGSSTIDPALRGQTLQVVIQVHDLKTHRIPELSGEFLQSLGYASLDDLRSVIREALERRHQFQQRRDVRRQVVSQLLSQVPFDLPADLVKRQEQATLSRHIREMRDAGFSDSDIRAREAQIRANAREATLNDLREHFLLSRIAEAEDIKIEDVDLELEIEAIAERTDESPRRVRARMEKDGLIDVLATQILERKALDAVLNYVAFEDVVVTEEEAAVETIDHTVSSVDPEADADESSPET